MALEIKELKPQPTPPVHSRWRRIVTSIPVPASVPLIERLRAAEPVSTSGMPAILWHEAEGFLVRDPYGNQWIDLTSGIVVANAGHSHPRIREAIHRATDQPLLATYSFPSQARLLLLEKLAALTPISDAKAILFSGGTEANECALMLMRRHGQRISPDKVGILSFEGCYHGRTLGAGLSSGSGQPTDWIQREQVKHFQIPFPLGPHCPWGCSRDEPCDEACFHKCIDSLAQRNIRPEQIAGIIAEPAPGWATYPMPAGYACALSKWAKENDILVCFDEVQSGCGRTGRFFAFEHVGTVPDLITLGKGLSSSLPASVVIGPRWLMDQPAPGDMSSTHGGNPVCAAAALANLEVIEDEKLVEASARTGQLVLEELQQLQNENPQHLLSIHGLGLYISAHFIRPDGGGPDIVLADAIVHEAVRRGVMMFVTGRGFLKVAPPLCIEPEAAIEAVQVIGDCFRELKDQAV